MSKTVLLQTIQFSLSTQFKCQKVLFLKIQFTINTQFKSKKKPSQIKKLRFSLFNPEIGPLSGATTPGQSGLGSDGTEVVLRILQNSTITRTSASD